MSVWFTSDLHLGHEKVAALRGFDDVRDHDIAVLRQWRKVAPTDIVWVLGDISSGSSSGWQRALEHLRRVPGRKRLINGNHDACSSIHRDAHRNQSEALLVFESVQDFARIRVSSNGARREALLSHYPYLGEGADHTDEPRYSQYRLRDEGRWLLHGHTHNADQRRHGHQIHVGLDAWGLDLVPLNAVIAEIESA